MVLWAWYAKRQKPLNLTNVTLYNLDLILINNLIFDTSKTLDIVVIRLTPSIDKFHFHFQTVV